MAVLVLQAFAAQRRAARGGAEQEAAAALVGGGPDQVAHALEAEHRVVDVEGQHRQPVRAVAGGRGRPAGQRAGFGDALLQDLAVDAFAVAHQAGRVLGLVGLALWCVDAHLAEQAGHAEGACLVGDDGHHARAQRGQLQQVGQQPHEGHRGAHLLALGLQREGAEVGHGGHRQLGRGRLARRQRAPQRGAALLQVLRLGAAFGRAEEALRPRVVVAHRQVEAVHEVHQVLAIELLLLVRGHAALADRAHAVALLGLGQDDHRRAAVRHRRGVGGVDLHQVVPAAVEAVDLVVGHRADQRLQLGALAEELVAVVGAVVGAEGLELAVHGAREGPRQGLRVVAREERVPVAAPHQLDDVPAGPGKHSLQFVHDAAVAAHRAVQPLQVAVDDEDQVVQPLAGRQAQAGERLGLVHLAVAEEAPHASAGGIPGRAAAVARGQQAPVLQVAHEARLVHRRQRPQAHRAGGELPEVRHQPGVGVAAEAAHRLALRPGRGGAHLLPVMVQVGLAQAAFGKGPRIDAGGRVRLEEHQIAAVPGMPGAKEVVEAHLEQVGRRGIAGDVAAQLTLPRIGAHHHRQRVPAHHGSQALLDLEVAREGRLFVQRDGVQVRRLPLRLPGQGVAAGLVLQRGEDESGALGAAFAHQRGQRIQPFAGLGRVGVAGEADGVEQRFEFFAAGGWDCGHVGGVGLTSARRARQARPSGNARPVSG